MMMNRSLKIMAIGLVVGAAVVAFLPSTLLFSDNPIAVNAADPTGDRYACPMMDFIGTHPGTCPVCGMKMERMTAGEITREQQARMGIEVATIETGTAAVIVRAAGLAQYDHRSTTLVIPRVAGRIVQRHKATFGCCNVVAAGEPIIELYSPEAFAAQGELQTAVKLKDQSLIKAISDRFERWNLTKVADAIVKGGDPVDTVTINSPVSGQVWLEHEDEVNEALLVGKEIRPDMPLIRLVDPHLMTMIVHVPETRADFLREGQAVDMASDERGPLRQVKATIGRLAREIDPVSRTVEVRIYISNVKGEIRPGALITASFRGVLDKNLRPGDRDETATVGQFPLIPKTAVLSTGVRHIAWKLDGDSVKGKQKFTPVPLWLGPRIEDENGNDVYVVRAGLVAGDRVATQGAFLIDSQAQLAGTPSLLFPTGAGVPASGHQH